MTQASIEIAKALHSWEYFFPFFGTGHIDWYIFLHLGGQWASRNQLALP